VDLRLNPERGHDIGGDLDIWRGDELTVDLDRHAVGGVWRGHQEAGEILAALVTWQGDRAAGEPIGDDPDGWAAGAFLAGGVDAKLGEGVEQRIDWPFPHPGYAVQPVGSLAKGDRRREEPHGCAGIAKKEIGICRRDVAATSLDDER